MHSMFPNQLLEISCSEERHATGASQKKPGRYHPYASSSAKPSHQSDQKSSVPAWKQIKDRQQGKKGHRKPLLINRSLPRGQSSINDNYCVNCVGGKKNCEHVTSKVDQQSVVPVIAREKDCLFVTSKRETVNFLHVKSCAVFILQKSIHKRKL